MTTYKLRTTLTNTTFNIPEINSFIGEEVEIIIKKRKKSFQETNLEEALTLIKKYIPKDVSLSQELISERRQEVACE